MLLQEKPLKRKFISNEECKFYGKKKQKGSIFPYHPAIGYRWNTNLSVSWNFKKENNVRY